MSQVVLYDLPSKGRCACWSLNPWKTRLALNFKGIDYKTEWVEYPDIKARLSPHVPANPAPGTEYTIPAVQFSDGKYIMDSKPIAERLEKDYPSPSLYLDSPILEEVYPAIGKIAMPLRAVWLPRVPVNLLNERSSEYFHRTREQGIGKPLTQFMKEEGGEEAWVEALPAIKALGELVKKNGGPYVMGKTPSYADFVVVGFLQFFKVIEEDMYQRLIKVDPALGEVYDACKPWLERDGH
ncbi:putative glutathione S-transferase [Leptodontidium sp. 2 PMI_412]|nr:putative glutathione S-transferase [Leptodontidium sp. 2 PMI_412]